MPIQIGYSLVHPNDRFVKKIGRELALKNLQFKVFRLTQIVMTPQRKMFYLESLDVDFPIKQLYFEYKSARPTVFLTYAIRKSE
jgi:hypothetical protein